MCLGLWSSHMQDNHKQHIQTVLDILRDEVLGDVRAALKKMSDDYSMTWMYAKKDKLFPITKKLLADELSDVYQIKGREYVIMNVATGDDLVVVEMIESYPDPETGKVYRTPIVLVLEMHEGKIRTGRHYFDPDISFMNLEEANVLEAFKKSKGPLRRIRAE